MCVILLSTDCVHADRQTACEDVLGFVVCGHLRCYLDTNLVKNLVT